MTKATCRSPECPCEIEVGQAFCGPYCESDVGKSLLSQPCKCGHQECLDVMKKKSEVSGAKVRPMVVVTGVSGLIGSALVDELARD